MQATPLMPRMAVATLTEIDALREMQGALYQEFLRVRDMSAGLYVLAAGSVDPQQPHAEDELYFIVAGRGKIAIEGVDYAVAGGSTIFVPALAEHRFHTIEEELQILVVFAPAESQQ